MRYPEGHKEQVRERIVAAASEALRKRGLEGVSIPALMKKVGLTHGGFYAHFGSRDELAAEAVRYAAAQTASRVFQGQDSLEDMLREYLSESHVAHPARGCVVAALGTEARHQSAPLRHAFAWAARGLLQLVERKLRPAEGREEPGDDALRVASQMVGAVVLARLVEDPELARRLLAAARDEQR